MGGLGPSPNGSDWSRPVSDFPSPYRTGIGLSDRSRRNGSERVLTLFVGIIFQKEKNEKKFRTGDKKDEKTDSFPKERVVYSFKEPMFGKKARLLNLPTAVQYTSM